MGLGVVCLAEIDARRWWKSKDFKAGHELGLLRAWLAGLDQDGARRAFLQRGVHPGRANPKPTIDRPSLRYELACSRQTHSVRSSFSERNPSEATVNLLLLHITLDLAATTTLLSIFTSHTLSAVYRFPNHFSGPERFSNLFYHGSGSRSNYCYTSGFDSAQAPVRDGESRLRA